MNESTSFPHIVTSRSLDDGKFVEKPGLSNPTRLGIVNILIADDHSLNRRLLRAILEAQGLTVCEVADGCEALALLEAQPVDAIISDILMPNMDGYRFCYEVRHNPRFRELPFILYSSTYTSLGDEKLAREMGADAFLSKPAKAGRILEVLQEICARARSETASATDVPHALDVMKHYSERLIAKLEERNAQLQQRTAELEHEVAVRKRAQEDYHTLVDCASDGILVSDSQGCLLDVNMAGCRMFGYSREELLTLRIAGLVAGVEAARIAPEMARLSTGQVVRTEWQCRRKDGALFPAEISATLLPDGRLLGLLRDITWRQQVEMALRQSEQQMHALVARLQAAREYERTVIAREVHDVLGQLLTGLKMDLNSLGRQAAIVDNVSARAALQDKAASALGLADELIGCVQRISAELRPSVLDNLGLPAAVRFEARRFAERSGIACEVEAPESLALEADDATGVFRILQEILTNVARHAGATRADIRLAAENDVVTLEARDNGRGIDETAIHATESLGLLGMRERARLMGGDIRIRGEARHGTTVTLTIPTGRPKEKREASNQS